MRVELSLSSLLLILSHLVPDFLRDVSTSGKRMESAGESILL